MAWIQLQQLTALLAEMPDPKAWGDATEVARSQAFAREERRLRFWAGRWALRGLLAQARGNCAGLTVGPEGRAVDPEGWSLSLSHSGPWVVAMVAPHGPVGVDVEAPKPTRDWRALAEHCGFDRCAEAADFYCQWTLMEAWFKTQPSPQAPYGWKQWRWRSAEAGLGWAWQAPGVHVAAWGAGAEPRLLAPFDLQAQGRWGAERKPQPEA